MMGFLSVISYIAWPVGIKMGRRIGGKRVGSSMMRAIKMIIDTRVVFFNNSKGGAVIINKMSILLDNINMINGMR